VAGTASAGTAGPLDKPQPISRADANSGGANGQCPGGPYCSTRDGSASLNGNGNDKAVGRPAAGSVGRADNKNPHGQMPNGADGNAGYECDSNHGIGRSNPAHTSCIPATTVVEPLVPPVLVPPVASPPPSASPAASALVSPEVYVGFLGSLAEALGTNPLPTAAAAGEANTDGQLVAAGTAAFAAFLVLGAGSSTPEPTASPGRAAARSTSVVPDRPGIPVTVIVTEHHLQAPVSANALNADGSLYVPPDPRTVGWSSQDMAPGSSHGTIILVSHANLGGEQGRSLIWPTIDPGRSSPCCWPMGGG